MTAAVPRPALVPATVLRPVVAAVGVAALGFAVLAVRFAGTSGAGDLDRWGDAVVDPIGGSPLPVAYRVVQLGSPQTVIVIAVLLAAACLVLRRRRMAVLAIAGPGITGVLTTILKPALGRTLAGVGDVFPSGHTAAATSLALVATLLVLNLLRPGRGRWLTILAAVPVVVGAAVGASLVAIGWHYPTDTIGGFCTAVVVVVGGALVLDRLPLPGRPMP